MFRKYPTGFDVHCLPESGPVERLVTYLCKYVSSPPISLRRIEAYDGANVTYRYADHRRGEVCETLSAAEFIGRMIRHLPPKNFRMVRYYGIYARPVREKLRALVADALKVLVRRAEATARYFARRRGVAPDGRGTAGSSSPADGRSRGGEEGNGSRPLLCPQCGSAKMLLLRIWSRTSGLVYDVLRDALPAGAAPADAAQRPPAVGAARAGTQMVFA